MPVRVKLDMLVKDPDSAVALWHERVLLQVRHGRLLVEHIQRIREKVAPLLATPGPIAGLFVVEEAATPPAVETRRVQQAFLDEIAERENARIAPVLLGDSVGATLNRSVGRMMLTGNPRVRRFASMGEAAGWLSTEMAPLGLKFGAADLVEAVAAMRATTEEKS